MRVHSLPAKSAVEPENAEPALMEKINKNISSLRTCKRATVGNKSFSSLLSLCWAKEKLQRGPHKLTGTISRIFTIQ